MLSHVRNELAQRSSVSELLGALRSHTIRGSVGRLDVSDVNHEGVEAAVASVKARLARVAQFGLAPTEAEAPSDTEQTEPVNELEGKTLELAMLRCSARMIVNLRRAVQRGDWKGAADAVYDEMSDHQHFDLHPNLDLNR